jgi:hypothetical protein
LVFVLVNLGFGLWPAVGAAAGTSTLLIASRVARHRTARYALGGLFGVAVATGASVLLQRAEAYFLPGMITGFVTATACLVSVVARRPLAAWASFLARRWPLDWYWHPRVRPAYQEVTLGWFVFYASRLAIQWSLFRRGEAPALATVNLFLGWPAIVLLLIGSYLYGLWRLRSLEGPSVQEFRDGVPPPWQGQRRGF